jgi:ubiquinone/menaquinone biosynthesis C-methylase UbiE
MRGKDNSKHDAAIVDQFTRQAVPFSRQPAHSQETFLQLMLKMSRVGHRDTVLDVACGPGLVACAFAARAGHVTGIDLTPAMIARAGELQQEKNLTNMSWQLGTVLPLPFPDESFSRVITRYTFHHFLNPQAVFAQMVRVCTKGGIILVADVTIPPQKREFLDYEEKLRDPSHTRTLTPEEFGQMAAALDLREVKTHFFKSERKLEAHLKASFPHPGDADKVRQIFREDIGKDRLGLSAHWQEGEIHFAYPVIILAGKKSH